MGYCLKLGPSTCLKDFVWYLSAFITRFCSGDVYSLGPLGGILY